MWHHWIIDFPSRFILQANDRDGMQKTVIYAHNKFLKPPVRLAEETAVLKTDVGRVSPHILGENAKKMGIRPGIRFGRV